MRWRHATDGGTSTWQCTLAPSTPEAVTVLLDPYSIPSPVASGQPSARTRRARPRATVGLAHRPTYRLSHTPRTHTLHTSAWHIRPVAAPGFGPRRTADNTARTIRHIAASAAPSSLSATRTRCGTRHESSAYTSGAFPSPATAPHAFVAAPPRRRAAFLRLRCRLSSDFARRHVPRLACGRSPRSRLTWTRQRERRPRRRPRRLKMQERRHRCRPARPS